MRGLGGGGEGRGEKHNRGGMRECNRGIFEPTPSASCCPFLPWAPRHSHIACARSAYIYRCLPPAIVPAARQLAANPPAVPHLHVHPTSPNTANSTHQPATWNLSCHGCGSPGRGAAPGSFSSSWYDGRVSLQSIKQRGEGGGGEIPGRFAEEETGFRTKNSCTPPWHASGS